jgi:hypothetical protein
MIVHKLYGIDTESPLGTGEIKEVSGNTITFCESLTGSASFDGDDAYIIQRSGLGQTFKIGNCQVIIGDIRYKRDPNMTPGADKCDGVAHGMVKNGHSKSLGVGWGDSKFIDDVENDGTRYQYTGDISSYVSVGDLLEIRTNSGGGGSRKGYTLVEQVTDSFIDVRWALSTDEGDAGEADSTNSYMYFYESAASEHGTDEENINAGHVQRTIIKSTLRDTSSDWRLIIFETPLYHGEIGNHDKWCDYDGNCFWKQIDTLDQVSLGVGNRYHTGNGSFPVEPGGVNRKIGSTGSPVTDGYNCPLEKVLNETDVTSYDYYYYDSTNQRLILYGNDYVADVYKPAFWERCAIRDYLVIQLQNWNAIGLGADRHFASLDDAGHGDNPWPNVGAAPLGRDPSHICCRLWEVDGKRAYYHAGSAANYDYTGNALKLMAFAELEFLNSDNKTTVTMYERDGTQINVSTDNDSLDYGTKGWLGPMEMDIIFASELLSESFEEYVGQEPGADGYDVLWDTTVNE